MHLIKLTLLSILLTLAQHVPSATSAAAKDALFSSDFLTFAPCDTNADCVSPRRCIYEYAARLFKCGFRLTNCLCIPPEFRQCTSSTQCVSGERCVSTNASPHICVSCIAAQVVRAFRPLDQPDAAQCAVAKTSPEATMQLSPTPAETLQDEHLFLSASPTPSYDAELYASGFALDRCRTRDDCAVDSYACRDMSKPLKHCDGRDDDYYYYYDCLCVPSYPIPCSHISQCNSGEFCIAGHRSTESFQDALCISKRIAELEYAYSKRDWTFFPPESNPFPDASATFAFSFSLPFYPSESPQSPPFSDNFSPSFTVDINPVDPSVAPTFEPKGPAADPSFSDEPFSFRSFAPTLELSPSLERPAYPSGWTLDRCVNIYGCKGDRVCMDVLKTVYNDYDCISQCYCLPLKLRECNSSSHCTYREVCTTALNVNRSYCVSKQAIENNPAFEILPYDDGSFDLPIMPSLAVSETPAFGSIDPVYVPPGYPTDAPSPDLIAGDGLTLSYCFSGDDCAIGYDCLSVEYAPCSRSSRRCFCVPNGGKGGTVCVDSSQCQNGEICFPTKRIDIVPSYCISAQVALENPKILRDYLNVFLPRGVGVDNRGSSYRDWKHPEYAAQESMDGIGLTGDACTSNDDCASGRVCADALNNGKICDADSNCTEYSYCYPKAFRKCVASYNCQDDEICTMVFGLYEDSNVNLYRAGQSVQTICLSQVAATRNAYAPWPVPTGLPRTLLGLVAWEHAEDILRIKFQNREILSDKTETESEPLEDSEWFGDEGDSLNYQDSFSLGRQEDSSKISKREQEEVLRIFENAAGLAQV